MLKYSKLVNDTAEIFLDGQISYQMGTDFSQELRYLATQTDKINIKINSPGGQVLGEWAILSAILDLQSKKIKVNTIIDGMAASAAGVIALAGNKISMRDYATIMIHKTHKPNQETLTEDEQKVVELLDQSTYKVLEQRVEKLTLTKWLDEGDKWFSAEEALQQNLIDEIIKTEIDILIEEKSLDNIYLQYSKILEADKTSNPNIEDVIKFTEYLAQKLEQSIQYTEFISNNNIKFDNFKQVELNKALKWFKNRNI